MQARRTRIPFYLHAKTLLRHRDTKLHLMTRQHTLVKGGPSLHLLYFLSHLSWVRQSKSYPLDFSRSLFSFIVASLRACRVQGLWVSWD
jgi:hypothetical protein